MRLIFLFFIIAINSLKCQVAIFPLPNFSPHDVDSDSSKIVEFSGVGEKVNNLKEGLWYEFFGDQPYSMGNYKNGKKEGEWSFYYIKNKTSKNIDNKSYVIDNKFKKAKLFCKANFINGKLNGKYILFNKNKAILQKITFNNDTIIDTLCCYYENGKLNYMSNYNKCYYDTAWLKKRGENFSKGKLPHTVLYSYINRKSYNVFEGYTDGHFSLFYDVKQKKIIKSGSTFSFLDYSYFDYNIPEGKYLMYDNDDQIAESFYIIEGRRIKQ